LLKSMRKLKNAVAPVILIALAFLGLWSVFTSETQAQWNTSVTGRSPLAPCSGTTPGDLVVWQSGPCLGAEVPPASTGTQLSFHNQPLAVDQNFSSAPTASTVDSYALSALPAACGTNGCRIWVSFSYYSSGGTGQGVIYASDGTSPFAIASVATISNQAYSTASGLTPEQFSSGATPTISILDTNYGATDVCAYRTPSSGSSTCGSGSGTFHSYLQVAVIESN
jgi:hypothetical protein